MIIILTMMMMMMRRRMMMMIMTKMRMRMTVIMMMVMMTMTMMTMMLTMLELSLEGVWDLYHRVMLPCWTARADLRPSITSVLDSLGPLLGERGQEEWETKYQAYMETLPLLHRDNNEVIPEENGDGDPHSESGYVPW